MGCGPSKDATIGDNLPSKAGKSQGALPPDRPPGRPLAPQPTDVQSGPPPAVAPIVPTPPPVDKQDSFLKKVVETKPAPPSLSHVEVAPPSLPPPRAVQNASMERPGSMSGREKLLESIGSAPGGFSGGSSPSVTNGNPELKVFRLRDLAKATQNFREPELLLGAGSFGKVFKGFLRDVNVPGEQLEVAVKRLDPESCQGQAEWLAEILILGKLRHENLVRLYGYCYDNNEGLLVYEFLNRGSLDYHLFSSPDPNADEPLPWDIRLKIAFGAAQGLAHLHELNIIHRDFKAPNILLDQDYNAKLTDFGLAKGTENGETHITTKIMGTMGYLDPKYMETGQLTKKSDVYAFGVMLLELLTGRRAMDSNQSMPLTAWAKEYLAKRRPVISELVDTRIQSQFESRAAQRAAHKLAISAKHCIEDDPNSRPLMIDMVETLRPLVMQPEEAGRAPVTPH
eukprot:TRINITY_DN15532_c0_g1_i1.p1 TRINITY_DN15532_c0_g1~~TRINITY_DN15532_c0_g1_i1.p1  ORF type:complete len:454 (-),score=64.77 TRINITY_DN15532_c0_g1_i1:2013-3374(-)